MPPLIDDLHAIGLPMLSHYSPQPYVERNEDGEPERTGTAQMFLAWTTDQTKADAARDKGALICEYRSSDPRFTGWEDRLPRCGVGLMDEHREEREELAQLARDDADDARLTREEWAQDSELEPYQVVMMESAAWSA